MKFSPFREILENALFLLIIMTNNAVPPQPPSNVRKTILGNITEGNNTFQFVKIKWDMLNDSDVSHYQVEANASNTTLETLVDNRGNATVSLENVDSDFITVEVFSVNKCQLRSTTGTRATITIPRNIGIALNSFCLSLN